MGTTRADSSGTGQPAAALMGPGSGLSLSQSKTKRGGSLHQSKNMLNGGSGAQYQSTIATNAPKMKRYTPFEPAKIDDENLVGASSAKAASGHSLRPAEFGSR